MTTGSPTTPNKRAEEIYRFWFGEDGDPGFVEGRQMWFKGGPDLDETLRRDFLADHERAVSGALDAWRDDWRGCLALILLLDQFPRNMFRGTARSFACDSKALGLARHALDAGHPEGRHGVEKCFFYLPFEHSEAIEDQARCVALFEAQAPHKLREEWIKYAHEHRDIIARFGRFPYRNEILGRQSTADEIAFLDETGTHFGTDPNRRETG